MLLGTLDGILKPMSGNFNAGAGGVVEFEVELVGTGGVFLAPAGSAPALAAGRLEAVLSMMVALINCNAERASRLLKSARLEFTTRLWPRPALARLWMGAGESWADAMAGPNTTSVPSDNADRENRNNLIL